MPTYAIFGNGIFSKTAGYPPQQQQVHQDSTATPMGGFWANAGLDQQMGAPMARYGVNPMTITMQTPAALRPRSQELYQDDLPVGFGQT